MAKILVIDDEIQIRMFFRVILENSGHGFKGAPDGLKGLELLSAEQFDIVIIDMIMPKKDGLNTIPEIVKKFPRIKIIAISGGDDNFAPSTYLDLAVNIGAAAKVTKPIEPRQMLKTVEKLLLEKSST